MNWVVFSYSLPSQSRSSRRVALWRRLRRLGAIAPAGGVQVLPAREECVEALQWLAQEIRQALGEAVVMRVEQFEGLSDRQLIELFQAARQADYAEVEAGAAELEKALGVKKKAAGRSRLPEALDKLRRAAADGTENLMPPILDAVKQYATVGEICCVLREVYGEYKPLTLF